jgi:hypothetical protein
MASEMAIQMMRSAAERVVGRDIQDQKEEGVGDDEYSDTGISFPHYEQKDSHGIGRIFTG